MLVHYRLWAVHNQTALMEGQFGFGLNDGSHVPMEYVSVVGHVQGGVGRRAMPPRPNPQSTIRNPKWITAPGP